MAFPFLISSSIQDALAAEPNLAAPASEEKIVFLRLRRDATAIKLLSAVVHPGHLKPQLRKGALSWEMVTENGGILSSGELRDPGVERLEYEDPNEPGRILVREIPRESSEFMLRAPFNSAARVVRFYLKKATVPGQMAATAAREPLGEIILPPGLLK